MGQRAKRVLWAPRAMMPVGQRLPALPKEGKTVGFSVEQAVDPWAPLPG